MAIQAVRAGDVVTVLPSAARTATPTVDEFAVEHGSIGGVIAVIDCTAIVTTPSVVFTLQGYDPVSTKKWTILASAAIVATGTTILRVHPQLTAAANLIAKDMMPDAFSFTAVHGNAFSITYSLSVHVL
jgi:hypothetical protein